jgi:hypothetical protein
MVAASTFRQKAARSPGLDFGEYSASIPSLTALKFLLQSFFKQIPVEHEHPAIAVGWALVNPTDGQV